jgi:hypothetical protein
MSMPGFTADVTLYHASENYRGADAGEGVGRGNVVVPQLPRWLKCGLAILGETAACLSGAFTAECIAAGTTALDICTDDD